MLIWKVQHTEYPSRQSRPGSTGMRGTPRTRVGCPRSGPSGTVRMPHIGRRRWSGVGSSGKPRNRNPSVTDSHTVAFTEAADDVGVTVWVLREWRRKNYFPEPHRRDGRLWFTSSQVQLLRKLGQFFVQHGARVTASLKPQLENVVSLTYANW